MATKYLNKSFLIGLFSLTFFLFCISSAKAITDCQTDADCPSGQSCVDEASVGSKGLGKICWKTTASATPAPAAVPSPAKDAVAETETPIQSTNPTGSASATPSASASALVPCGLNGAADCTLCHLVLGFKNIYDYLLSLLLVATTLVIVVAGVMYMVSSGDKGLLDKAKSALTVALTAMILGLTAWLIINVTLNALGFKNAGSWYNFTCDTAQTQGPTGGTGEGTLPAANPGGGGVSGSYTPSGNLDPRVQKVLGNYMTMNGMTYGAPFPSGAQLAGKETMNCGSTCREAWMEAGLPDYEKLPKERWDEDPSSLKPGDICLFNKSATNIDHAFMIMDQNGMTTAAGGSINTIRTSAEGLTSNINKLKGNPQNLYVVHIANYLK